MSEVLRNRRIATLALAIGLGASACGAEHQNKNVNPSTTPEATQPANTNENTSTEEHTLVFDDLGGGSSIINIYPGVENIPADKLSNGTYNDGDSVPAKCETEGRMVHSDPSVGERDYSSNAWIKIHGTPGETQYATAVYVEHSQQLVSQLPDC